VFVVGGVFEEEEKEKFYLTITTTNKNDKF